jgi:hypothetical protein
MTRQEHLLTIVTEECNEVGKVCSKALRFGLDHKLEGKEFTNQELFIREFNDLAVAVEMAIGMPVTELLSNSLMSAKRAKVEKFLQYSKECGTLN